MRKTKDFKRDQAVTRYIHRLFWQANLIDKWALAGSLIFWPVSIFLFQIILPLQMALSIQAIINNNEADLHGHLIVIAIVTVLQIILMSLGTLALDRHGARGGAYIQRTVFQNFLSKDYDFYANNFIGSLGAQAANLREAYIDYQRILIFEVPRLIAIMLGGVVVVAFHSIPLALITLGCMVLTSGYTFITSSFRLPYRRIVSRASAELSGILGDALSHGSTIKSFASNTYESRRLEKPLNHWQTQIQKMWDTFVPVGIGRNIISAGTIIVLLLFTAHLYFKGAIPIAIVALVQLYVIRLITATQEIMEHIKAYESMMSMAHHPAETMMVASTINDPIEPEKLIANKIAVDIQSVSFAYPDAKADTKALSGLNITIQAGEKVGVVGYSGSGKSTLTKLLMRFMDVTDGSIEINGIDVRKLSQQELRSHIAYVPQEPLLFHRSIHENIAYGNPDASEEEVMKAASLAYVNEFVDDLPKGYKTFVGERGVKLSGGQRQRVAIARAILRDAPLLILDEATSALDSRSERRIQEALGKLIRNRTALVIAHRLSTIQRMDRIIVMDRGQIVQVGTHTDLLKDKNGIYAELWSHQSGGYLGGSSVISTPDAD